MAGYEELNEENLRMIEHYNPVTVTTTEATGVVAMSIIAFILLFALLRSQRRIRELQQELYQGTKEQGTEGDMAE